MLLERDIHVWTVDLNLDHQQINEFSQFLTSQERQRAAKFINPIHGDRWILARGYLRRILSQYLDLTPAEIVFSYGLQGKPAVEQSNIQNNIQFNLSHSGDRAVYAISAQDPIGIDLEYIHPIAAADLVDRFFSAQEQTIFHSLPVSLQQSAFFHAWTQKEAYLKACGTGLSTPLDQIEVSIDPRTPAAIVSTPTAPTDPVNQIWQIQQLKITPEYAGAIVVGGGMEIERERLVDRLKYQLISQIVEI
jgi:4'-phosphopantetheinyl transferase